MIREPAFGEYRTIVADPPWEQSDRRQRAGVSFGERSYQNTTLDYPTMTLREISDLPVSDLVQEDAHLYLWTTTRLLRESYSVAEAWGFRVGVVLVWAKPSRGFGLGDAFQSNVEFVLFARRGRLRPLRRAESSWFAWPRGSHSIKPEAFFDLVESVSPGPYLELFARRQRLGWDTWGNEALKHVELAS